MKTFIEKLQCVNNYKNSIDNKKVIKRSDDNNSYDAIDRDAVKNDVVTEIKLCVSR